MSVSPRATGPVTWSLTKVMNMRDLSRDDDYLSHLLVEKLGTGDVPLHVHKMDPTRTLPKTDPTILINIVRRVIAYKGPLQHATRRAVDELLLLGPVRYYLQREDYCQRQINAFATHASRYFELYHPSGSIEISHTSRYTHRTGKAELCILATRPLAPGTVITELKGSMANLTDDEDRELKRRGMENSEIRRDFSVIHSKSMKKNHLFLGPARFVNHDCDNNCELFREGRYITFRVLRPIVIGQEITAHYGDGYFGRRNKHCLCETCERNNRGGYAPEKPARDEDSDSSDDSDLSDSSSEEEPEVQKLEVNLDERRTRRGVYHVAAREDGESDDDSDIASLSHDKVKATAEGEMALVIEADHTPSDPAFLSRAASSSQLSSPAPSLSAGASGSISSTRRQKINAIENASTRDSTSFSSVMPTPPPSAEVPLTPKKSTRSTSRSVTGSTEPRRSSRLHNVVLPVTPISAKVDKGKGKEEVKVKKEEVETARLLRARPSTSQMQLEAAPKKPEPLRGPDGKLLPTCVTCRNVLPLLYIDSEVVWGGGMESLSKKKKSIQECPRCLRHFAIYRTPWPARVPSSGAVVGAAARDDTDARFWSIPSRSTPKVLSVLDRKPAEAISSASARSSTDKSPERPSKRRKIEPAPPPPMDPAPVKDAEPVIVDPPKRKRGRPRIHNLAPPSPVKVEEKSDPTPFRDQPRNSHGRFEKKSVSASISPSKSDASPVTRRTRAERAQERDRTRTTFEEGNPVKSEGADEDMGMRKLQPRRGNYRPSILFHNPNPTNFAMRAWQPSLAMDESSDEDDRGPVTPEDHVTPSITVEGDEDTDMQDLSVVVTNMFSSLGKRPNPFTLSQKKWSMDLPSPSTASEDTPSDETPPPSWVHNSRDAKRSSALSIPKPKSTAVSKLVSSTNWSYTEDAVQLDLQMEYPSGSPSTRPAPPLRQTRSFSSQGPYTQPKLVVAGWEDMKMDV